MSKVGGALPAWYWPDGIPRRSPVPQQTLDRLIKRGCRKSEAAAIVWQDRSLTCGELLEQTAESARAIAALLPDDAVVAIVERDPGDALVLALAVMQTGKQALIADLSESDDRLARTLADSGAVVALAASDPRWPAGARQLTRAELDAFEGDAPKLRSVKATAAALIIPDGEELAVHSNYSLAAMSVALTAFIPELKGFSAVVGSPLWHWESLTAALCALLNGSTVFAVSRDRVLDAEGFDPDTAFTVLLRDEADELAGARELPAVLREIHYVFVSTGYFKPRWRRAIEARRGREVLPLWGRGAFGPAVAAHPTWFPFEAHGIPLVNVRVLPIDPGSGEPSLVPWEMLERAEIGVESPAQMTGYVRAGASAALLSGKIMRTHTAASVDHVGVVVLHKPPRSKAGAA
ncbi:MAG: hypothetical protein HZB14_00065 [Actinobacteria bacterium]|nr:hypothetical protein [Actinomycetota bacterium]